MRYRRGLWPAMMFENADAPQGGGAAAPAADDAAAAAAAASGAAAADAAAASAAAAAANEDRVPIARLNAQIEARQAAEAKATAAEQALAEAQRKDMSDVERLKAEAEDARAAAETAKAEAQALRDQNAASERTGWIKDAATKANFHDPADAAARLQDKEIKTPAAAERAVAELATSAKHLVRGDQSRDASSLLDKILSGEKVDDKDAADKTLTKDEIEAMTRDQLMELQQSNPELYARSIRAAASAA